MKKFLIGLLCGVILAVPTFTYASDIQAFVFPSRLLWHNGRTVQEIDLSGDKVINYDNHAYISLRALTDASGADVQFQASSAATGYVNQIDVYAPDYGVEDQLNLQDPDGYVSIGKLITSPNENGYSQILSGGVIKINKDLTGKAVDIDVYLENGQHLGSTDYLAILNEDIDKPKIGDIRPFTTNFAYDSGTQVVYKVAIHDILKPVHNDDIDMKYGNPIGIFFSQPYMGSDQPMTMDNVTPFTIDIYNTSSSDIDVKPINIEFNVYSANADNQPQQLVYSYPLPAINGNILEKSGYHVVIPWNHRNLNGEFIAPGTYVACLKASDKIHYSIVGSNESQTTDLHVRYGSLVVKFE